MSAITFNKQQISRGVLGPELVTELVRSFQAGHDLDVDGFAGPATIAALQAKLGAQGSPPVLSWPLAALADGRTPQITSGHSSRNPSRSTHHGVDLFYAWRKGDAPIKVGDGGAAGKAGNPRWWIPDGTPARAAATGRVILAGDSPTGHRVWLDHGGGWLTGYFHLSALSVAAGGVVFAGEVLGTVGDNPSAHDARHLHFEVYHGPLRSYPAGSIDPQPLLERADVPAAPPAL